MHYRSGIRSELIRGVQWRPSGLPITEKVTDPVGVRLPGAATAMVAVNVTDWLLVASEDEEIWIEKRARPENAN